MTSLNDIADLSQALAIPLVAVTLLYAVKQVRHMAAQVENEAKARRLMAAREFLDLIAHDDVRSARRWALAAAKPSLENPTQLQEEDIERLQRLAVAYDRVGFIVRHELLDLDMVNEWVGPEILELWHRVRPVIIHERRKPGRAGYCRYFESLAASLETAEQAASSDPRVRGAAARASIAAPRRP